MRLTIVDRETHSITRREYTDEGFLKVPGRVARTGLQEYIASELGLPGDPKRIVNVLRPPEEVFSSDSLKSFVGTDVTIEHPDTMVNSKTYKKVSVGTVVSEGRKDGDFIVCDLIIKDADAVQAAEHGKVQLSVGYSAVYDNDVPEEADYEFIQRDIEVNHVALVNRARAGIQARLFDKKPELFVMTKVTLDSGKSVDVSDANAAALVNDSFDRLNQKIVNLNESAEKAKAVNDALKHDLEKVKKASSDEAIAKRVKRVSRVLEKAKLMAGDSFHCESMDIATIQKEALKKTIDNIDWNDKSDIYIQAAFDIHDAERERKLQEEEEEDPDEKTPSVVSNTTKRPNPSIADAQHRQLAQDGARSTPTFVSERAKWIEDNFNRGVN